MYTLFSEHIEEIEIERSKFIAISNHVESQEEIKDIIKNIKKRFPKAKHYCYGYALDGNYKGSDDGEPKGTAGRPLVELLKNKKLDNVLIVVVRYFGGILLGASRLLRTYVDAGNLVIQSQKRYQISYRDYYEAYVDYSHFENFKNYLSGKNVEIEHIEYRDSRPCLKFYALPSIENEIIEVFHNRIVLKKIKEHVISYEEEK